MLSFRSLFGPRLKAQPLGCCCFELFMLGLVPPNDRSLRRIVQRDAAFTSLLNRWYDGMELDDHGLDTLHRQRLRDLVAQHFTGESWPHTTDAAELFAARLLKAAKDQGWNG